MLLNNKKSGATFRFSNSCVQDSVALLMEEARNKGFIALGLSSAKEPLFFKSFQSWLKEGKHGDMKWLERNSEIRADTALLLKGCKTVISLAYPYSSKKPATPDNLTTARFTEPQKEDYHIRIRKYAQSLVEKVSPLHPKSRWRVCVDSAPILERSYAYGSGIGFIGKNNMLIIPGYGSYFFLAEILTTAELPIYDETTTENLCGECSLCINACPSGALEGPFSLNSKKCLSYLTVEHKGEVGPDTGSKMGNCFFGCDACQEVCPFNGKSSGKEIVLPLSKDILKMNRHEFKIHFGTTAFSRAGLEKLKSNIIAIHKDRLL